MALTCNNNDNHDDSAVGGRRTVLRRIVTSSGTIVTPSDDDDDDDDAPSLITHAPSDLPRRRRRRLRLMMMGCDDNAPYGPTDKIGSIFIDLIANAIARCYAEDVTFDENHGGGRGAVAGGEAAAAAAAAAAAEDIDDGQVSAAFTTELTLVIYRAKLQDYPCSRSEWDSYDGVILPGSTSAAYDEEGWIQRLKHVIRTNIYAEGRKSLGVCFGHQVYAHTFGGSNSRRYHTKYDGAAAADGDDGVMNATSTTYRDEEEVSECEDGGEVARDGQYDVQGLATACPSGFKLGRRGFRLTPEGRALLLRSETSFQCRAAPIRIDDGGGGGGGGGHVAGEGAAEERDEVQLLYSHGDIVQSLPPFAVSLGGTDAVPIQAAAYFSSVADAERFRNAAAATGTSADASASCSGSAVVGEGRAIQAESCPAPLAITFQAHPEFLSVGGMRIFSDIVDHLKRTDKLPPEEPDERKADAEKNWEKVHEDSLGAIISVGRWFGWF